MLGRASQQSTKKTQGVRSNHVSFVGEDERSGAIVAEGDVEMVVPKIGHHLANRVFAVPGVKKFLGKKGQS